MAAKSAQLKARGFATPLCGILGFPQVVYTGTAKTIPARSRQRRGGFPEDYLPWVRNLPAMRSQGGASGSVSMDYLSKVPYRSIGR